MNKIVSLALLLILSMHVFATDELSMTANTKERKEVCSAMSDIFTHGHAYLKDGYTPKRIIKKMSVELAGEKNKDVIISILGAGTSISEEYIKQGLSQEDLVIDFMFQCVNSGKTIDLVITDLANEKMPEGHPLRSSEKSASLITDSNKNIDFNEDGSLSDEDYENLLGDKLDGVQALSTLVYREDGVASACGYEFSHSHYDYTYTNGKPVKISGSINLNFHPVSYLAVMLKIKGEEMTLYKTDQDTPRVELNAFKIANIYPIISNKPLLNNHQNFDCEDPDYICHVNFQWDEYALALMSGFSELGYKKEGKGLDVSIKIDFHEADGSEQKILEFNDCVGELLKRVEKLSAEEGKNSDDSK